MANDDKKFDGFFRQKLSNHEEKPSLLAWEKLESQLPKKKTGLYFPSMRIAASILLLIGLGYLGWFLSNDLIEEEIQVAKLENTDSDITIKQVESTDEKEMAEQKSDANREILNSANDSKDKQNSKVGLPIPAVKEEEKRSGWIAEVKQETKSNVIETIDLPELELPEITLGNAVALVESEAVETEVAYTITIRGSGIKESEPVKQGFFDEIEEKVEKIGGLLNKVDQGFAELQDAKNNLFASITSRKERNK